MFLTETEYFIRIIKLVNTFSQVHAWVGVIVLIVIIWVNNEPALQGGIKKYLLECACTQELYFKKSSVHAHKRSIKGRVCMHTRVIYSGSNQFNQGIGQTWPLYTRGRYAQVVARIFKAMMLRSNI